MNIKPSLSLLKIAFLLGTGLLIGALPSKASVYDIFYKLDTGSTLNPAAVTVAAPGNYPYSGAAPVSGTTWNKVDKNTVIPTGTTAGQTYTYSANNQAAGGVVLDAAGNTFSGVTLTITYYSGTSTGTRTEPANGSAGENTIQPGGVLAGTWRTYYGGNYFTYSFSGLPASTPFDLFIYGANGTTSTSTAGGNVTLVTSALGSNPTTQQTYPAAAANSAGAYGAIWTGSSPNYTLMGTNTWQVIHGQTDASGNFVFRHNGGGNGAYFNGFQLVRVPVSTYSVTGGGSDCTSVMVGLSGSETGVSYQIYNNGSPVAGSAQSGTGSALSWSATASGTYTVVGTVTDGTSTGMTNLMTGNASVTINAPTTVSLAGAANLSALPGDTVTISVSTGGTAPTTYVWKKDGVILNDGSTGNGSTYSGATTSTLTISNVQTGDSAATGHGYTCTVSGGCGSPTSAETTLLVANSQQAPAITGLTNQTVIAGSNATLTAYVTGVPTPDKQWYLSTDGGATSNSIAGQTNQTLTLANVQYSQNNYQYIMVASNAAGTASSSMTLTVLVPVSITGQPQNLVVTNTQGASFSVTASGVPSPAYYQWYFNGVAISGANLATYMIANASPSNIGGYSVVVSNSVNVVTSSVATLTVNSTMAYTSLTPANGATGVCYDTPLYLNFSSAPTLRTAGAIKIYNATNSTTPVDTIDLSQSVTNHITYAANVQAYVIAGQTFTNFPVIITGNQAAIYPHQGLLTSNQTYYVTVDNGTFADSAGAYFSGITATNAWRFTTKTSGPANATNLVVAQDYSGDFATVQGAVNFAPSGNITPTVINIRDGTYTEVVNINSKNNLDLRGQSRSGTVIGYPNNNNLNPGAPQRSSLIINGNDCTLETLTLTNMTPVGGGQAEAVDVEGTRAIFYNMELDSHQDTFLVHYSGKLVYFQDSLVSGDTDFIWGYGTVYFTNCEIRCLTAGGHVTQPRSPATTNGFGFFNCQVTKGFSSGSFDLGRTIGNTNATSETLFANCLMDDAVTGYNSDASTNMADFACSNLTATAGKTLLYSTHSPASDPYVIAVQSAPTWLYGWQPQVTLAILTNPVSQTVSAGQTVIFAVSATGIPAPSYQWTKNGTNLAGQVGTTLAIINAQASDVGDYKVIVSNSSGTIASSNATLILTGVTPTTPTGLNATAGINQVALSWAPSPAAASYNVKRSTSSGGTYTTIASTTAASFTDSTAVNGTTYYYVVSALNSQGESANSGEVSATPSCITPSVPGGVSAVAGNAQVALNWSTASAATSYNVKRATVNSGPFTTIASVATTTYTDATTANGTTYYYVVSAANSCTESANSPVLSATPMETVAVYQVNSGGAAVSPFAADAYYSGGSAYGTATAINTNGLVNPAPMSVYQTERWGNSTYTFTNLTAGASYVVRLHFAELYWGGTGQRVFNVSINGSQVLTNFDIVAAAGSNYKAVIREFTVSANGSGQITVQYTGVVDNAKSSGIEILNATAAPVITSQPSDETVSAGGTATFTVIATGYPSPTYQWLKNGTNLVGQTGVTLTLNNVQRADQGTYCVVLSNNGGAVVSRDATLAYLNTAPVAGNVTYARNAGVFQLNIAVTNLLAGATDVDGDSLTLVAMGTSTNGITLTTSGTNYLVYYNTNNVNDQFNYTVTDGFGGTNSGIVSIVVSNSAAGQLSGQFTSFSNNVANLTFHAIPGYSYITERTTNLTDWVGIATNTAATNGVISVSDPFTDLGGIPPASAYYRLKYQP